MDKKMIGWFDIRETKGQTLGRGVRLGLKVWMMFRVGARFQATFQRDAWNLEGIEGDQIVWWGKEVEEEGGEKDTEERGNGKKAQGRGRPETRVWTAGREAGILKDNKERRKFNHFGVGKVLKKVEVPIWRWREEIRNDLGFEKRKAEETRETGRERKRVLIQNFFLKIAFFYEKATSSFFVKNSILTFPCKSFPPKNNSDCSLWQSGLY